MSDIVAVKTDAAAFKAAVLKSSETTGFIVNRCKAATASAPRLSVRENTRGRNRQGAAIFALAWDEKTLTQAIGRLS